MADPVPLFKPSNRGEIPEAPEWLERWMAPYDRQIKALTDVLAGGITPTHEAAEVKVVPVRHGVSIDVSSTKVKGKPSGVQVIASENPIKSWSGVGIDQGTVRLTVNFDTPVPAGDVDVTIKILGG